MAGGTRIPTLNRSSLFSLKEVKCWEKSTGKWRNSERKRGLDERKGVGRRGNFHKMAVWRRPWGIWSKTTCTSRFFFGTVFSQRTLLRGVHRNKWIVKYWIMEWGGTKQWLTWMASDMCADTFMTPLTFVNISQRFQQSDCTKIDFFFLFVGTRGHFYAVV